MKVRDPSHSHKYHTVLDSGTFVSNTGTVLRHVIGECLQRYAEASFENVGVEVFKLSGNYTILDVDWRTAFIKGQCF